MFRHFLYLATISLCAAAHAQVGGGQVYDQSQSRGNPEAAQRAMKTIGKDDMPPTATSMFLDASVLINVPPDRFVALFGIAQEGATIEECNRKMDDLTGKFIKALVSLGIHEDETALDFVAQNRIYGFDINGDVAKEKLAGFELKKNVAISYEDKSRLDLMIEEAAKLGIYDLIKVDYIVENTARVQTRLMEEAAKVIQRKSSTNQRLLGVKVGAPAQVFAERYGAYYPIDQYDSYIAAESEEVSGNFYRQRFTIQDARKSRTFYFNALDGRGFDQVINPVVTEPVVQFTVYLKVKYPILQASVKPKTPAKTTASKKKVKG